MELPVLSEQMVRRDNFFHSCWMQLKQERPDLWEILTTIELEVAGLPAIQDKEQKDEPDTDIEVL